MVFAEESQKTRRVCRFPPRPIDDLTILTTAAKGRRVGRANNPQKGEEKS
jgi:hypothetical protein